MDFMKESDPPDTRTKDLLIQELYLGVHSVIVYYSRLVDFINKCRHL